MQTQPFLAQSLTSIGVACTTRRDRAESWASRQTLGGADVGFSANAPVTCDAPNSLSPAPFVGVRPLVRLRRQR